MHANKGAEAVAHFMHEGRRQVHMHCLLFVPTMHKLLSLQTFRCVRHSSPVKGDDCQTHCQRGVRVEA